MDESRIQRLRGPFGWRVAALAIDRPALWGILRLWLPLSRLWAAAMAAKGDPDAFMAAIPLDLRAPDGLAARLARFEKRRQAEADADAVWNAALFAAAPSPQKELNRIEAARGSAARWLTLQRLRFLNFRFGNPVPPVRYETPSPAGIEEAFGATLADPSLIYSPPAVLPEVEVSHRVTSVFGQDYWLRFRSPYGRMGDMAWARVHEPAGVSDPPTFIFGNGIMVEFDHYGRVTADAQVLIRNGMRVIEIESPWHGRRRLPGTYGGEPFIARAPVGPIDLFAAQAQETAVIIDWCRRQGRGPVAIGGASMGALAALLAVSHAPAWPETMRPDAVALLTVADQIDALVAQSALTAGVGMGDAMAEAGWTADQLLRWQPLTAVPERPPLPPERIVAVLGARDTVLPYASGRSLVERWRVPEENTFIGGGGHFSTPLGLAIDRRPLRRLAQILKAIGPRA